MRSQVLLLITCLSLACGGPPVVIDGGVIDGGVTDGGLDDGGVADGGARPPGDVRVLDRAIVAFVGADAEGTWWLEERLAVQRELGDHPVELAVLPAELASAPPEHRDARGTHRQAL